MYFTHDEKKMVFELLTFKIFYNRYLWSNLIVHQWKESPNWLSLVYTVYCTLVIHVFSSVILKLLISSYNFIFNWEENFVQFQIKICWRQLCSHQSNQIFYGRQIHYRYANQLNRRVRLYITQCYQLQVNNRMP